MAEWSKAPESGNLRAWVRIPLLSLFFDVTLILNQT